MNIQIDTLNTTNESSLCADVLRDLLDNEIILIGGGQVAVNGY